MPRPANTWRRAPAALLCLATLAATSPEPQRIEVRIKGVPSEARVYASRDGAAPVELLDDAAAQRTASIPGAPARSARIELEQQDGAGRRVLFDGLVLLPDQREERLAFTWIRDAAGPRAERVAQSPNLALPSGRDPLDPRLLALGWGGLLLGWCGTLALCWSLRGRRGAQA